MVLRIKAKERNKNKKVFFLGVFVISELHLLFLPNAVFFFGFFFSFSFGIERYRTVLLNHLRDFFLNRAHFFGLFSCFLVVLVLFFVCLCPSPDEHFIMTSFRFY